MIIAKEEWGGCERKPSVSVSPFVWNKLASHGIL